MHLNVTDSSQRNEATAIFEFELAAPDAAPTAPAAEALPVEFSHTELYDLFTALNQIQSTIDGLSF